MGLHIRADTGDVWDYYLSVSNVKAMADGECDSMASMLDTLEKKIEADTNVSARVIGGLRDEIASESKKEKPDHGRIGQLEAQIEDLEIHVRKLNSLKSRASSFRGEIGKRQQALSEPFRSGLSVLNSYLSMLDSITGGGSVDSSSGGGSSTVGSGSSGSAGGGFQKMSFRGMTFYADNSTFDANRTDGQGRTNLQRMQKGMAPIGKDGLPVNLHHMQQSERGGGMMELTATTHSQNHSMLHINSGSNIPSGINRQSFAVMRKAYWKQRAKSF